MRSGPYPRSPAWRACRMSTPASGACALVIEPPSSGSRLAVESDGGLWFGDFAERVLLELVLDVQDRAQVLADALAVLDTDTFLGGLDAPVIRPIDHHPQHLPPVADRLLVAHAVCDEHDQTVEIHRSSTPAADEAPSDGPSWHAAPAHADSVTVGVPA